MLCSFDVSDGIIKICDVTDMSSLLISRCDSVLKEICLNPRVFYYFSVVKSYFICIVSSRWLWIFPRGEMKYGQ